MVAPLWFNSGVGVAVEELGSELHGLLEASSRPVPSLWPLPESVINAEP